HGPVFWSEIGRLETVAQRGVYMDTFGHQHLNLPKGPIEEEGTVPKLFRRYSNLHGDLSDCTAYNALARDDKYGPRFLSEFADRLYFGTDFCAENMKVELCDLLIYWRNTGKISEETFRKVAYENAEKLLGL
ncbi:MAG: amidohydrolase family protein, partial [Oscillospiraceae bacterium]|nr:amidohydrolase family protein [Oscillospiraceae bacterium]